jgi:hypothetical protein
MLDWRCLRTNRVLKTIKLFGPKQEKIIEHIEDFIIQFNSVQLFIYLNAYSEAQGSIMKQPRTETNKTNAYT